MRATAHITHLIRTRLRISRAYIPLCSIYKWLKHIHTPKTVVDKSTKDLLYMVKTYISRNAQSIYIQMTRETDKRRVWIYISLLPPTTTATTSKRVEHNPKSSVHTHKGAKRGCLEAHHAAFESILRYVTLVGAPGRYGSLAVYTQNARTAARRSIIILLWTVNVPWNLLTRRTAARTSSFCVPVAARVGRYI